MATWNIPPQRIDLGTDHAKGFQVADLLSVHGIYTTRWDANGRFSPGSIRLGLAKRYGMFLDVFQSFGGVLS